MAKRSRLDIAIEGAHQDMSVVYVPPHEDVAKAAEDWWSMSEAERLRYSGYAAWRPGRVPMEGEE